MARHRQPTWSQHEHRPARHDARPPPGPVAVGLRLTRAEGGAAGAWPAPASRSALYLPAPLPPTDQQAGGRPRERHHSNIDSLFCTYESRTTTKFHVNLLQRQQQRQHQG